MRYYLIFMLVILIGVVFAKAVPVEECRIVAKNTVLCKMNHRTSLFRMVKGIWMERAYYRESKDQTEAVYVTTFGKFDPFLSCMRNLRKSPDYADSTLHQLKTICDEMDSVIETSLGEGKKQGLPVFRSCLSEPEQISVTFCMRPDYVRTYRYSSLTQEQIDRRDYHDLKPNAYCTEFLESNKLYWTP